MFEYKKHCFGFGCEYFGFRWSLFFVSLFLFFFQVYILSADDQPQKLESEKCWNVVKPNESDLFKLFFVLNSIAFKYRSHIEIVIICISFGNLLLCL